MRLRQKQGGELCKMAGVDTFAPFAFVAALEGVGFEDVAGSGSSLYATIVYPTYIRFLDMKRLGNYRIYNRPIWGILYRQTLRDIRYEFSDWLAKFVSSRLADGFT